MRGVTRLAWASLGWNLVVVLLGALVRATGSGAGCGRSWPTCHGEVVPALEGATAVEFTHRVSSGLALVLVAALAVAVFRSTQRGHPARLGAVLSGVALVGESLIGAAIVLFAWVGDDSSPARAVTVPLHLVNTLLLLAGLTLTLFWSRGGGGLHLRGAAAGPLVVGGVGMLLLGATGAVTALADTLFPKDAFTLDGVVATGEHFLTELRVLHPVLAVVVGVLAATWARRSIAPRGGEASRAASAVVGLVVAQILAGAVNVLLVTPVWMQIVHLALADLLWIAWVWMAASVLADGNSVVRAEVGGTYGRAPR